MKNPKITLLTALVIILVILNVVVISIMWMHRPMSGRNHQPPFVVLEKGLAMTPDQKETYAELRMAHRQLMENTRNKAVGIRMQLHHFDNIQSDSMVSLLTDSLGKLHADMERNTYEHFAKVRNICTPEQKQKFDLIIPDVLKSFVGPPPHHRRGGHQGHRPPEER